jgi:hypothetical protein
MAGPFGTPNRQPIFTQIPILVTKIFNPAIANSNYTPSTFFNGDSLIYTAIAAEGTLVNKITISATGDTTNTTVSAKLVYVYLYQDSTTSYSLYKTSAMPAATISDTVVNPSIELNTSGLVLNVDDAIYVASSVNYATNTSYGDYLSITIEGGAYTYA